MKLLNEDVKFTQIDNEFLQMVKTKTPNLYQKFFNLYKNKGLDYAKEQYKNYDPTILAQKEVEKNAESLKKYQEEKRKQKNAKIQELKSLLPEKPDMESILNDFLLDKQLRESFHTEVIPQLSTKTLSMKTKFSPPNDITANYEIFGYLKFPNVTKIINRITNSDTDTLSKLINMGDEEALIKYIVNIATQPYDEDIVNDIVGSRKTHQYNKKLQKLFPGEYDYINDAALLKNTLAFKSKLSIKLMVSTNNIRGTRLYTEILFTAESSKPIVENISTSTHNYTPVSDYGDVLDSITKTLIEIKSKILLLDFAGTSISDFLLKLG